MLSDSKVSESGIAIFLKDDILRFQVLMDDLHGMDVFQGDNDAGCDEFYVSKEVLIYFSEKDSL